jgi:hypothetical protein
VNGISVDVWRILLVAALAVGLGLGAVLTVAFRPAPADEADQFCEDCYQEGRKDERLAQMVAALPAVPAEDLAGPDDDPSLSLAGPADTAALPPAVQAPAGGGGGEDFLHPDFGQLDPAALDAANTDLPGPVPLKPEGGDPGRAGKDQTEAERQFAFDWDVTMWQLEMAADVAAWDQQIKAMA